jgi:nitrite reductase/ring-hydroxylating ferredoxin subunit
MDRQTEGRLMQTSFETEMRALCRIEEIPDGGSMGFPAAPGGFTGLMAIRQGDKVRVYVNACPHIGTPLDWVPGRFLTADGTRIICATHGAEFAIESGLCVQGPCRGDSLEAVVVELREGTIYVPSDAGL